VLYGVTMQEQGVSRMLTINLNDVEKELSHQLGVSHGLFDKIKNIGIFAAFSGVGEEFYDELEENLILSDMGVETAMEAVEKLRCRVKEEKLRSPDEVRACLRRILAAMLDVGGTGLNLTQKPAVVLFIGVNGVGKTTTIGKLAARLKGEGKRVLVAAADTFRAAAAEQLTVWADRTGVDIVKHGEGADPARWYTTPCRPPGHAARRGAGGYRRAPAQQAEPHERAGQDREDVKREQPDAEPETLLVLDATTGQNGLAQARQFRDAAGITGIVLTKLDGTAKGGIVVAIARTLGVPVKFVGLGEGIDDLAPFDAEIYVEALI
jgi:fused signal recognition particle receptor